MMECLMTMTGFIRGMILDLLIMTGVTVWITIVGVIVLGWKG